MTALPAIPLPACSGTRAFTRCRLMPWCRPVCRLVWMGLGCEIPLALQQLLIGLAGRIVCHACTAYSPTMAIFSSSVWRPTPAMGVHWVMRTACPSSCIAVVSSSLKGGRSQAWLRFSLAPNPFPTLRTRSLQKTMTKSSSMPASSDTGGSVILLRLARLTPTASCCRSRLELPEPVFGHALDSIARDGS